jgi:hypothetical protein
MWRDGLDILSILPQIHTIQTAVSRILLTFTSLGHIRIFGWNIAFTKDLLLSDED